MTLNFSQGAEEDAASAVRWYNDQHPGLGIEFLDMLQHLMQSIETAPESFAREEGVRSKRHLRQGFLRRFPYQVVFEIKQPEGYSSWPWPTPVAIPNIGENGIQQKVIRSKEPGHSGYSSSPITSFNSASICS